MSTSAQPEHARGLPSDNPKNGADILANASYWFEHELRQYPGVSSTSTRSKGMPITSAGGGA